MGKYADIIHLPRPKSQRHAAMSMIDRGAQFAPFAALVGYDTVIQETARLTDAETELDECAKELLDRKLRILAERQEDAGEIRFLCFVPDRRKQGGSMAEYCGAVRRIDRYRGTVLLEDGTAFPIESIREIAGLQEETE